MESIYQETHYRGIEIMHWQSKCQDGFIVEMLEQNYRLMQYCLSICSKLFMVKVDLHFPLYSRSGVVLPKNEKMFPTFIGEYARYLKYHRIDYAYFWTRERDLVPRPGMSENPFFEQVYPNPHHHYHMNLILPYSQIKQFYFSKAEYAKRLKEYWGHAIQFVGRVNEVPVWFPENGQMVLTRETLPSCFSRISYICKTFSKETDLPSGTKRWSPSSIPRDFILETMN